MTIDLLYHCHYFYRTSLYKGGCLIRSRNCLPFASTSFLHRFLLFFFCVSALVFFYLIFFLCFVLVRSRVIHLFSCYCAVLLCVCLRILFCAWFVFLRLVTLSCQFLWIVLFLPIRYSLMFIYSKFKYFYFILDCYENKSFKMNVIVSAWFSFAWQANPPSFTISI